MLDVEAGSAGSEDFIKPLQRRRGSDHLRGFGFELVEEGKGRGGLVGVGVGMGMGVFMPCLAIEFATDQRRSLRKKGWAESLFRQSIGRSGENNAEGAVSEPGQRRAGIEVQERAFRFVSLAWHEATKSSSRKSVV